MIENWKEQLLVIIQPTFKITLQEVALDASLSLIKPYTVLYSTVLNNNPAL